ncbi:uncharacterized protein V2V93DRAFT_364448 [Kockiozyma suomiensis]|uniref:uncharacterized protein n=1 Tax=Kockiozyma suomiensis TaxID=1337062 RepID=UPI00334315AC
MSFLSRLFSSASDAGTLSTANAFNASAGENHDSLNDFVIVSLQDAEMIEAASPGHIVVDVSPSLSLSGVESAEAENKPSLTPEEEYVGLQVRRLTYAEAFRQGLPPSGMNLFNIKGKSRVDSATASTAISSTMTSPAPSEASSLSSPDIDMTHLSSRKVGMKMFSIRSGACFRETSIGADDVDQERLLFPDRKTYNMRRREKSLTFDRRARQRMMEA